MITRNFPPLIGGMEKLNLNLYGALKNSFATRICGPRGSSAYAEPGVTKEAPIRPLPVFLLGTLVNAVRLAWSTRPGVVIGGSGLVAPIAWCAAKLAGGRLVLYLHGLDIVVPSKLYQRVWLSFIRRADQVLVNSANTKALAISRGIAADRIEILHPGTDLPLLDRAAREGFRNRHQLGGANLLLSVGRFTRRKGLTEFVLNSFAKVIEAYPEAKLVIIGDEAVNALSAGTSGAERQRIVDAARAIGVEDHLIFLGHCDDATLSDAYQAADCHIFPVQPVVGDVEGFGMVALEAAAHALPTVAFAIGGIPDAVAPEPAGYLVEGGDYAAFAQNVSAALGHSGDPEVRQRCLEFASQKSWACFGDRLRALLAG